MKTSQGGYKAMIRDRVPHTVDFCLKWLRIKTKWVDHVYTHHVWYIKDNQQRNYQTRALMGLTKATRGFNFDDTIDWANIDQEETRYWRLVATWVHWFERNMLSLVEMYETLRFQRGEDHEYIKNYLMKAKFDELPSNQQDKLYKMLIQHFHKYYF